MTPEARERRRAQSRAYRAAHPEYFARWNAQHRERENARKRRWKLAHPELVNRWRGQPTAIDRAPLPLLMPELQRGREIAFWEDELRLDLAQERHLAVLEDRDPDEAATAYRSREHAWRALAGPFIDNAVAA